MSLVTGRLVGARNVAGRFVRGFLAGANKLIAYILRWNGVDAQAYMVTSWVPRAYKSYIEFDFTPDAIGTTQHLFSGTDTEDRPRVLIDTLGRVVITTYNADTGLTYAWTGGTVTVGERARCRVDFLPDDTTLTVNGVTTNYGSPSDISNPIEHIAIRGDTNALRFDGVLHRLNFLSPAQQDANLITGNGVDLYALLSSTVTVSANWTISIRWRRKNYGGGGKTPLVSNGGGNNFAIYVHDTDSATPGRLEVYNSTGVLHAAFNNALLGYAEGQEVEIAVANVPGLFILFAIDGVILGGGGVMSPFSIDRIGHAGGTYFQGEMLRVSLIGDAASLEPSYNWDFVDLTGSVVSDSMGSGVTATLQNYDSATDQIYQPRIDRRYRLDDGPESYILEDTGATIVNRATDNITTSSSGGPAPTVNGNEIYFPGVSVSEQVAINDYSGTDYSGVHLYGEIELKAATLADVGKEVRIAVAGAGPEFNDGPLTTITLTETWQKYPVQVYDAAGRDFSIGGRLKIRGATTPVETTLNFRSEVLRILDTQAVLVNVDASDWEIE